jgi:hypothetical protein
MTGESGQVTGYLPRRALAVRGGIVGLLRNGPRSCKRPREATGVMRLLGGDPGPGWLPRLAYPAAVVAASALARSAVLVLLVAGVLGLVVVAVLVVVVCPAVWSRKKLRRDAALKVLDRIVRFR